METVLGQISNYINRLDWAYILTFILIAYAMNHEKVKTFIVEQLGIKIKMKTRYRVLITGSIYGVILFFLRGYKLSQIETLIQSFIFAMVFHKLLIDIIVKRLFPNALLDQSKYDNL